MHKINSTLLEKLFISPAPLSGDKNVLEIYNRLKSRMFPGEESFIAFLKAQNTDSQFQTAEIIIHRLCFESNYPPSFFAIKDIITLEECQKEKISEYDSYIPRDHFLHIVNLYLLGIYIFFYNSEFHNRIIRNNRFQRSIVYCGQYRIDSYKDFISEWKYFCLFHDIGYVPELFANELLFSDPSSIREKLLSGSNDFCDSLYEDQLTRQTAFFGSIEVLSRVLAWNFIKSSSRISCNIENKLFSHFKKNVYSSSSGGKMISFEKECKSSLSNLVILDRIYSNACLKPLLPVIGDKYIALVGIDRITGEIAFVSLAKDNQRELYYSKSFCDHKQYSQYIEKPSLLLFDDFAPSDYEFVYLCNIQGSDNNFSLSDLYPSSLIVKATEYYKNKGYETILASVTNEEQLMQFYYDLYNDLYQMYRDCRPFVPSNKESTESEIIGLLYNSNFSEWEKLSPDDQKNLRLVWGEKLGSPIKQFVLQDYSKKLDDICEKALNNKCKPNLGTTGYNDLSDKIDSYLKLYAENIINLNNHPSRKKVFITQIVESEAGKLETKEALLNLYAQGFYMLYHIFSSVISNVGMYRFDYTERKSEVDMSLIQNQIDRKNISVEELMETYIHNLTKENDKYIKEYKEAQTISKKRSALSNYRSRCDHGFESVKYASSMFSLLQSAIKKVNGKEQETIIDILFSLSNNYKREDNISHYVSDYKHIFQNVIYAIMIHNIWPSVLKKNLDTTIESEPFTYFALMCDSLQQWNRPQGLSHSLTEFKPYKAASEEYDIVVKDNQILLYEANTTEMQERLNKSIKNMNDYLKNIEALIKIEKAAK